ncbi:MAG: MetQ/NlpA family ABC transporter substrate-binding protein [Treponema sp.]|jgi:D-methionine transport system substrate-binding protein|nr:MetQ/NlpA family ABC transporter substrate-binding protein [Treponema sp.]
MKKGLMVTVALVLGVVVVFAGAKKEGTGTQQTGTQQTVVKIGLMGEELRPAWNTVAKALEQDGIKVELVNFSDYAVPNRALSDGDIDLNSFQHDAFLQNEIKNQKYDLTAIGNTVIFFLGVYSHKIKSLDELQDGDTVVIMNDATNGGRALKVLEAAGVFTLDPSKGNVPTIQDIVSNPKNIQVVEVDASQTWRTLDDPQVAAAVVNSNFVVDGGGVPAQDAIYIKPIDKEGDKPYINLLVARTKDKDNPVYRKVVAAFQTETVAKVITDEPPLKGTALPAW